MAAARGAPRRASTPTAHKRWLARPRPRRRFGPPTCGQGRAAGRHRQSAGVSSLRQMPFGRWRRLTRRRGGVTLRGSAFSERRSGEKPMKLMWFHLMPYTELPEDFREKNPSVWVDIHSSLFDPRRAHHMYNDFMDELEFAAECGSDAVCVNEHHSNGYGLMPSPNRIASALA